MTHKVRKLRQRIDRSIAYYVLNEDLKLKAEVPGHEVLVIKVSKDGKSLC